MRRIGTSLLLLGSLAAVAWIPSPSGRGGEPPTPPDKKGAVAAKKRKPHFTIGKETTYVTGPLDEDGYIDYAAALNKRLSQGVTPANNANVLLWKALGPHPERATMPADFFKWMGIEAPPERGEYFIPLGRYMSEHLKIDPREGGQALYDESERCSQRPWSAKQHPNIAAWLKANEKPLALVVEATKRSHYFSPLVPTRSKKGSSGLIGALMPGVQYCRGFANALTARAMLRVAEGRPDDAWKDLLACHRLGRLVAHGATLIEALVGIAIDTVAGKADLAFLDRAELKSQQIKDCLRDLQKLPPMPPIADKVDLGERFAFLDIVMMIQREGLQYLEGLSGGAPSKVPDMISKWFVASIDWDVILRLTNRWYDRMAKAMRAKDRATREKQLDQIDKELGALIKKSKESMPSVLKLLLSKDTRKMMSEKIGNIWIGLLLPAVRKVQNAADRTEQLQSNLYLAFALAAYRRDHGRYPKELDALAPKYLGKIPQDIFSGKALIYRPSENGYLLYSVGVNGRDEQGRSYEDKPEADDLTVRMPLPKLPRK